MLLRVDGFRVGMQSTSLVHVAAQWQRHSSCRNAALLPSANEIVSLSRHIISEETE
jgi:hypothetical protein